MFSVLQVIKQSHVILSFLAMECKITNEHIDVIWQAAQLKHCSKQVHDLLPPLIKNLEAGPVLHLYGLLCKLEPKDHTEQSLYLASALIKFIWTSGGTYSQITSEAPFLGLGKTSVIGLKGRHREMSSSENSVSMEATNSEDEQADSSQQSDAHKTPSEISDGPSSCKQARKHKKHVHHDVADAASSDGSVKIEDLDIEEEEEEEEEEDEDEEEEEEEEEEEDEEDEEKDEHSEGDTKESSLGAPKCMAQHKQQLPSSAKPDESTKSVCRKLDIVPNSKYHGGKRQMCSDNEADADAEKSGTEEIPVKLKKKRRKILRKRKKVKKCVQGKRSLCENGKHCGVRLEECSDEEEEGASGSEEGGTKEDICMQIASGTDKEATKDAKSSVLEPDQEVPNVLVREGGTELIQLMHEHSQDSSRDSTQGGVMTELASLVQGSEFQHNSPHEIHDCRPYIRNFQAHRELMDEMMSGEEGSYSSRMSNKSEKNMADFDGEESGCDDELVQLAAQAHLSPHSLPQHLSN
ncbi:hypothetical protein B7P43_G04551, partial [Cryptotermes secundus]